MGILKTAMHNSPDLKVRAVVRVPSAAAATFSRLMTKNNFISFFAFEDLFFFDVVVKSTCTRSLHPNTASKYTKCGIAKKKGDFLK